MNIGSIVKLTFQNQYYTSYKNCYGVVLELNKIGEDEFIGVRLCVNSGTHIVHKLIKYLRYRFIEI